MAISPISGQQFTPQPTIGSGNRPSGVPDDNATLRALDAADQGSGTLPLETARSVSNADRAASTRERQQKEQPSEDQVKSAVEKLNEFVKTSASNLQFSVDKESGMRIIKVVDPETKDVIRQIPSEEAVEIAKAIGKLQGLLIKQTA